MKEQKKSKAKEKVIETRKKHKFNNDDEEEIFQKIGNYRIYFTVVIGEGTYGKVYKAKKEGSESMLACKVIYKIKIQKIMMMSPSNGLQIQKRFKTQSQFHKQLSGCPNIVRLEDTIENQKGYYLIMEFCETDLARLLKVQGILSEQVALKYFREMLQGYKSIYDKNAFHRDLKPQNLLIKNDTIKISDFGFVKIFSEYDYQCRSGKSKMRTQSKVGSIKYMSPDVLGISTQTGQKTYNAQKSDIWSMGIILYKMLYGKQPFYGKNQEQMIQTINQKQLKFPDTVQLSPEIIKNSKVSPQVIKLIKKMIEKDQSSRISFKKLYSAINSIIKQRQNQKMSSNIKQQTVDQQNKQGEAKSKKQQLIIVYNKLMVKIYHDCVNYATLRQLGIENYSQVSYKIMTLIHDKRTNYIETEDKYKKQDQQISQKLQQEISSYHNSFSVRIKNQANLKKEDTLQIILTQIYEKIKKYEQFDLFIKQVQIYLIDLLLLLSLELKIITSDYAYTWSLRADNYKKKVILSYKQNTLKMLQKKFLNQQQEQNETNQKQKQMIRNGKSREKSKKSGSRDKKKQHKQKKNRDSRQKSQDKRLKQK